MTFTLKKNPIYQDYIISKVLGHGKNGNVQICIHKQTQVKYALKIIQDPNKGRHELNIHWKVSQQSEHVVKIIDAYENLINNRTCVLIVMELMNGGELFQLINEKRLTETEIGRIMFQLCTVVKQLHSINIAHRDIKPENILLTSKDENAVLKLTDFEFAKDSTQGLISPCYTLAYAAPEVLNFEKYDKSCDVWSLGVIFYTLCCGQLPFYSRKGDVVSPGMKRRIKQGDYCVSGSDWSRVPDEVKKLIQGMLEIRPTKRLTIEEFLKSNWMLKSCDEIQQVWSNSKNQIEFDLNKNKLFEKRMKFKEMQNQVLVNN